MSEHTGLISSYQLLITAACTNIGGEMKSSHSRAADRCPFVPRHSVSQVTSFMQLRMLWECYYGFICSIYGLIVTCILCNKLLSDLFSYVYWAFPCNTLLPIIHHKFASFALIAFFHWLGLLLHDLIQWIKTGTDFTLNLGFIRVVNLLNGIQYVYFILKLGIIIWFPILLH